VLTTIVEGISGLLKFFCNFLNRDPEGLLRIKKVERRFNKNKMFKFKQIASVLAGTVLASSTIAIAAAANYPSPFVDGGSADVAIVYGSGTGAVNDLLAVLDINNDLSDTLARNTASGGSTSSASITGEAYALFTSSKKIYLNDSIDKSRSTVSSSDLPVALKSGSFEGDVTATYDQRVDIGTGDGGTNNRLAFDSFPTSDDDPIYAIDLGTTAGTSVYNLTVTFNKAVAFNNSDSEGEDITLFGQKMTVAAATDGSNLVLLKSAQQVSLSSDDPSAEVTVKDSAYTVELISASDTAATVRVTDSTGKTDSKEINEDTSKTVNGLEVSVTNADETNLKLSATISVGSDKIKLTENTAIKLGTDEDTLDGTLVRFGGDGSQGPNNITKLVFQVAAEDTDVDALTGTQEFVDPFFGSVKLSLAGLNIPTDSTTAREIFEIKNSGSDKMTVNVATHDSAAKTVNWYYNKTDSVRAGNKGSHADLGAASLADAGGDAINVFERQTINKSEYVVVGNEDTGGLWELKTITNDTSSATGSEIKFVNVFSGDKASAKTTTWGTGTIDMGTQSYTFDFRDNKDVEGDEYVQLRYQDGSRTTADNAVIFPTIETSLGAKMFFYQPTIIDFGNWDGTGAEGANITALKFPDGDGYTTVNVVDTEANNVANNNTWFINGAHALNLTNDEPTTTTTAAGDVKSSVYVTVGQLTYNISNIQFVADAAGADAGFANQTAVVQLMSADNSSTLTSPALVFFEEQDDASSQTYEAIVVEVEGAGTTAASLGVSDVGFTWGLDSQFDEKQVQSDTDLYKSADFWGAISVTDQGDTDSYSATISYPDEQVYAQLYFGENAASIVGGTSSGGSVVSLGNVYFTDSEASRFEGKNLIVIGGSCVNRLASDLLGGAGCGPSFTDKTGVGSGGFLIETFSRSNDKVATLVAGYDMGDTRNAAKVLTTGSIDTTAGMKYRSTSATAVELVTA
jgi:hypothetical protein